jgi:hypothetical protein
MTVSGAGAGRASGASEYYLHHYLTVTGWLREYRSTFSFISGVIVRAPAYFWWNTPAQ